jgi:hypothetical protein
MLGTCLKTPSNNKSLHLLDTPFELSPLSSSISTATPSSYSRTSSRSHSSLSNTSLCSFPSPSGKDSASGCVTLMTCRSHSITCKEQNNQEREEHFKDHTSATVTFCCVETVDVDMYVVRKRSLW